MLLHVFVTVMVDVKCVQVFFNFRWLHAKLSCMPLHTVLADFSDCLSAFPDLDPAVSLMMDAIRLSASMLGQHVDMLGAVVTGRLLPYYKTHARIRDFSKSSISHTYTQTTDRQRQLR